MYHRLQLLILAICAWSVLADVPACSKGGQVDGQNPIGPWTTPESCAEKCYFQETDSSSSNYQMQCKGKCGYEVPACGTSVCPPGAYTCTAE
ncbi:unnamed protein product [Cercospora beticola]|nr:unnamed protein product [Cercospora beticola]